MNQPDLSQHPRAVIDVAKSAPKGKSTLGNACGYSKRKFVKAKALKSAFLHLGLKKAGEIEISQVEALYYERSSTLLHSVLTSSSIAV